jgi:hypothetical protein
MACCPNCCSRAGHSPCFLQAQDLDACMPRCLNQLRDTIVYALQAVSSSQKLSSCKVCEEIHMLYLHSPLWMSCRPLTSPAASA